MGIMQYTQSKGFAEDLTEGKFSYPVIHGIRANQNDGTLIGASFLPLPILPSFPPFSFPLPCTLMSDTVLPINPPDILKQRPTTPTLKTRAIAYLRSQTKSFEHTHDLLERLDGEIMDEIARFGGNKHLMGLLEMLRVPTLNE